MQSITSLISVLTLEEKVSLLSGKDFVSTPGVERLGIPPLKTVDSINGIRPNDFHGELTTAAFPNTTCLASTWNTNLLQHMGVEVAKQARTKHAQVVLGPTINIQRDPRSGRNFECFSEDPLLSGYLAAAIVNGIQGEGLGACPKHFVCNDSETFRRFYNVDESLNSRTLREIYLAAWSSLLEKANPVSIMTAYNKVDGTFCSENKALIQDVLRREWKYDGAVMSDWFGTHSTAAAVQAGLDLEMPLPIQRAARLRRAVESGEVEERSIDERVEKILELRERTKDSHSTGPESSRVSPETNSVIRDLAQEGIVLLKNVDNTLPLKMASAPSIAVIGEYASRPVVTGGGSASCKPQYRQVPLDLLRESHPGPEGVKYASGVRTRVIVPVAPTNVLMAADNQAGVDVSYFNRDSAEPILREFQSSASVFMINNYKPGLVLAGSRIGMSTKLTPTTTGKHLLAVRHSGSFRLSVDGEQVLERSEPNISTEQFLFNPLKYESRLEFAMEAGRSYSIHIDMKGREPSTGEPTPYGLTLCFEESYSEEEAISEAEKIAAASQVSIIYAGRNEQHESEGFDAETITLPANQARMISRVAAASKKTIVLLHCGNPIDVSSFVDQVDAILNMHFPGQEGPKAAVDILTGKVNPSGRLAATWFKCLEDWPSFQYSPAREVEGGEPVIRYTEGLAVGYRASLSADRIRWPFGHGLSYTTFAYSDLRIQVIDTKVLRTSVRVVNTGAVPGQEVVQIYVSPPESIPDWRPQRELKEFTKISLQSQESKEVVVDLDLFSACKHWREETCEWVVDPGVYRVCVGNQQATFST